MTANPQKGALAAMMLGAAASHAIRNGPEPLPTDLGMDPRMPAGLGIDPRMPAGLGMDPRMPAGLGIDPRSATLATMMLGAANGYSLGGRRTSAAAGPGGCRKTTKPATRSRMAKASRKKNRAKNRPTRKRTHAR